MQRYDDGGSFARALADVLHRLALSQSQRFLPLDLVVHMVNDQLTRDFGRSPNASESGIDARPAPVSLDGPLGRLESFFPNPNYRGAPAPDGAVLAWLGRLDGLDLDLRSSYDDDGNRILLRAIEELAAWLMAPPSGGIAMVAGRRGAGKSTVLGLVAVLSSPVSRELFLGVPKLGRSPCGPRNSSLMGKT